jgi:hypothetical protein
VIGWLQPGALFGLLLAAAPVVIHLLRTRRAQRVQFPSIRFVRPSVTAAVRLRLPSDWVLLAVRTAIVMLAVCAAAQPVWLTRSRLAAWNARTARAIVVDVSASMRVVGPDGRRPADAADEAASAERRSAAYASRFDSEDLPRELARAAAWLRNSPPARREIVVISDAQQGAIEPSDLAGVPAGVGIRFIDVGSAIGEREIAGFGRLGVGAIPGRTQQVTLSRDETRLRLTAQSSALQGLRLVVAPDQAADAERLLRTVAIAGAPAPSSGQAVVFLFPDGQRAPAGTPVSDRWMLRTLVRLQQDQQIQRMARRAGPSAFGRRGPVAPGARPSDAWEVAASDSDGTPLVLVAASGPELIVAVGAPVSSLLASAVVRATLTARHGPVEQPEAEVLRVPRETLLAWSRPAGPVGQDGWRRADSTDGRWFWIGALILLIVEQWLRSRTKPGDVERQSRAAA